MSVSKATHKGTTTTRTSEGTYSLKKGLDQETLSSLNIPQDKATNLQNLANLGGVDGLADLIGVRLENGLTDSQVQDLAQKFGKNEFPSSPKKYFIVLLYEALSDLTLLVLLVAATVSLAVGVYEDPDHGWVEAIAIYGAVILVAFISAGNDYSKELQFRALEKTSQQDEKSSVVRGGSIQQISTSEIVVGDIIKLQSGDMVPADCIMISHTKTMCNESSLTGEPEDIKKSRDSSDPFLLSSTLIAECDGDIYAIVTGIGLHSQWGKIKSSLVTESVNTPLQDKLEKMTKFIGYIGVGFAIATFIALVIRIFTDNKPIAKGFIDAFILAVTIVVVAIPEGLPLAVVIALAYSTKQMYKENCFIRVLAACETMGNATNICSDKTGTLTQNKMTVVQAWVANKFFDGQDFPESEKHLESAAVQIVTENASINRTAYYVVKTADKSKGGSADIIGNKTEASLMTMTKNWGRDPDKIRDGMYIPERDKIFAFDSKKKRSTAIVFNPNGTVRLYCKGASEWVLKDCSTYLEQDGSQSPLDDNKRVELEGLISNMANQALRTLVLSHKDFASVSDLPADWESNLPDDSELCVDCIVGIIDPVRPDVVEAVARAHEAGVIVRMVTGDNIATAAAIARQCGILKGNELCMEGPTFRNLSPHALDDVLPTLRVLARSSPEDKRLLVTRLNGYNLPQSQEEWEDAHKARVPAVSWDQDRDTVLPGYYDEWKVGRPEGGDVVGVTGDGTNDAPALKAADVGLSMGITGTKVAQEASDIVILDDRFSSIVNAIRWGRGVYDNIRKFLQFQLCVNIVALILVFIGAVVGFGQPLNAVMMLWVNLVMDTMGALALATEAPPLAVLKRKPYKRTAPLIGRTMWKNIILMSIFQLTLLFVLLFKGQEYFGVLPNQTCIGWKVEKSGTKWDATTGQRTSTTNANTVTCPAFKTVCGEGNNYNCFHEDKHYTAGNTAYTFGGLKDYEEECLKCESFDYTMGTIIFNTFIFCQFFHEYVARTFDNPWFFSGILRSPIFLIVSLITAGLQIFLVELGGEFVKTSPLNLNQWLITIALGAITIPVGMLIRLVPVNDNENDFFDSSKEEELLIGNHYP